MSPALSQGSLTRPWPVFLCALLLVSAGNCLAATPDFNFHIRPLLSDRCYKCHGPDEKSRKADLRLDIAASAYVTNKDGRAVIAPGRPQASELIRRIKSADPDVKMPPPDSNLTLDAAEISLLEGWIAGGARYKSHWAFTAPTAPVLPDVRDRSWPRHDMDRFVLHQLEKENIAPRPPADRERLLRRVTFDLTGLPPTSEDIATFLNDARPDAYGQVVDRLLSSPAYGERMAAEWLDVARFADTYGYQADRFNHLWPWRDWVIRAFNSNLAYDDFIVWQLAGDLLPGATHEQKLATAFNRNHRQTNEGGSVDEEFRVEYNADRLHTTASAFLGLTMECARCHDHKYDPISQRDYYRLFAFFNSTDESGLYSHFTDSIPSPTLLLYRSADEERRHQQLRHDVAARESALKTGASSATNGFNTWLTHVSITNQIGGLTARFTFDEVRSNQVVDAASGKIGKLNDAPKLVPGRTGSALQFDGENSVGFEEIGVFDRDDPFSFACWLQIPEEREEIIVLHRAKAGSDAGSRGYQLQLENGYMTFALIHFWPGNAIKVRSRDKLLLNQWVHVGVTYDGSSRARGLHLYVNGRPADGDIVRDQLFKTIGYGDKTALTLAARFRCRGFKNGTIDDFMVFDRALTPIEMGEIAGVTTRAQILARARAETAPDGAAAKELWPYYLAQYDPVYTNATAQLQRLRHEENKLINQIPEIMVMGDLPKPRPTYILKRGAYDAPTDTVTPGVPESIMAWDPAFPTNRLGLARWLVDPRNPLTARVTVNRYWQMLFGRGLVTTTENLGSQGALPSHPELIDWLALWLIDHDWDLKAFVRMIVTSATYTQSSETDPALLARDPENSWLGRGPRTRLTAEMLRDQALAASRLLVQQIGGPSVKPYQPDGLWEEKSGTKYDTDRGAGLYRRSLYTFWKRTSPHPAMTTFDATSRETCVLRRQTTTTPLQALVLLNDPQFVEAARVLAQHSFAVAPSASDHRLRYIFVQLTSRAPRDAELAVLRQLYEEQLAFFRHTPDAAGALLKTGANPVPGTVDPADLAAHAIVASAIMNFDDAVMKR